MFVMTMIWQTFFDVIPTNEQNEPKFNQKERLSCTLMDLGLIMTVSMLIKLL